MTSERFFNIWVYGSILGYIIVCLAFWLFGPSTEHEQSSTLNAEPDKPTVVDDMPKVINPLDAIDYKPYELNRI